ncbi:PQQ-binding-like beta-propeller repeat protein [Halocalculus aciditolerans]|uniref:Pyrrolo-quinoline quinone repeat domain-containing protein n=1 Tax=Halocalculus aciditolerans TaxID=1383812 RepID=A0A830FLQ0_9EURY|nr:PQQ-binding-like beta-propeller repeat protein [Halocalculus aciditolerans]GGL68029.1 hypothetical protein GCM10009039_27550 [Halocalculus aciditolerans]
MPSNSITRRSALAALGSTAALTLSGCLGVGLGDSRTYERNAPVGPVDGAWPTYQYDFANTGFTAASGPSDGATVEGVVPRPSAVASGVSLADGRGFVGRSDGDGETGSYRGFGLDGAASWTVDYPHGKSTPTVAGDAVFVSTAEHVAAYDARDGALCWKTTAGGYGASANAPALAADTVVDVGGRTVYGRDPVTGATQWSYDAGGTYPGLTARDGVVYTPTGEDREQTGVAALDPATGDVRWRRDTLPQSGVPLAVGDTHLYYAAHRGDVYALALDDGSTRWQASLSLPEDGSARLALADGRLHAQSSDGALAAFDAQTGDRVWERSVNASFGPRPPVVAADTRFALGRNALYAFDAATGDDQWSLTLDARPALSTAPAVRDGELYYAGPGRTHGVFRVAD